ncbi:MAG: hypothetical protein ACO1HP_05455 [Bacteroidota bacterium]|jgi:hypothetical protein
MSNAKRASLIAILMTCLNLGSLFAQDPGFSVSVGNAHYIAPNLFEFDIMIQSTGSPATFNFRTFQGGLFINPSWKGAGTITASYVSGSTQLSGLGYNGSIQWNPSDNFINLSVNTGVRNGGSPQATVIGTSPVRVMTMRLFSTANFNCSTSPNLQFNYNQSVTPLRLRSAVSWRTANPDVNYNLHYPGRTFGGTAVFNGETWSLSDADGRSPVNSAANPSSCPLQMNLVTFIQAFVNPSTGLMDNSGSGLLNALGESPNSMDVDTITVTLVNSSTLADVESQKVILKSDGSSLTYFTGSAIGTSCYIRVNHRNSLETWSAGPVNMAANTTYNFSSNQNQAYGDNLVQVAGVWAMYSGDVNQDGFIGGDDVGAVDNDNLAGLFFTYTTSDINGDLFVGGDDVGVVDNNNLAGVYLLRP